MWDNLKCEAQNRNQKQLRENASRVQLQMYTLCAQDFNEIADT